MREPNASSTSLIETVAGFSAGIVSTLTLHPLDLIKTRLQGPPLPVPFPPLPSNPSNKTETVDSISRTRVGSSTRLIRSIYVREGGIAAFYRGLTPNIIGNSSSWAAYFLFYGNIKQALSNRRSDEGGELGASEYFFASGAAGIYLPTFPPRKYIVGN